MCNPTAQDYHGQDRCDDASIAGTDLLLRHLRIPVQVQETQDGFILSDRAFTSRSSDIGISIELECLLKKDGILAVDRGGTMPNAKALASVTAEEARFESSGVAWTPKPEEPELKHDYARAANPYHGEIIKPMTNKAARDLAAKAQVLWVSAGVKLGPFSGQKPEVDETPK